ncbi:MAG: hypothetical protein HYR88_01560 [Verrucomicrobia bacterium]|nr:hypothetical protein [Verrucomicrobiota bacterium]MBI3868380.1 hypothetical protein [Verrucomicrobiota bacterium]
MDTIKRIIGKTTFAALSSILLSGTIALAQSAGSGGTCAVLKNTCYSGAASGKCQSERCPGECAFCRVCGTNLSGSGSLISINGKRYYCIVWSGPCQYQPQWSSRGCL